jgi:diguanylate cyclase (GGDEF)-like protein
MMNGKTKKVLLVEDNPAEVRWFRELLADNSNDGFEMEAVGRISEALVNIRGNNYAVILLDLGLPDGQGLDTVREVHAAAPHIPIVVMTGLEDEAIGLKAVQVGAQDYLNKSDIEGPTMMRAILYAIERHRLQVELLSLALTDFLTGLYNRRGFMPLADQQLRLARRMKLGVLLLYIDLDGLKLINDEHGHMEGDQALVDVASLLKRTYRESDIIARLGGDEFVVLAVKTGVTQPIFLTNSLLKSLTDFNEVGQRPYDLSLSIGVAHYTPGRPSSIEELLAEADKDLYTQKRSKRGEE